MEYRATAILWTQGPHQVSGSEVKNGKARSLGRISPAVANRFGETRYRSFGIRNISIPCLLVWLISSLSLLIAVRLNSHQTWTVQTSGRLTRISDG
ncbi:hypothetical protein BDV28DRAFT_136411 [Aspergillus coremiiformis]|uniref:Uncharacterized protein n=1 Tax=Aspergillus coremiiformis TaxID=138285 RepID=A0A5N6Z3W2_9EURO|nr:hypothetical protein BDV28DRAFT_136411 [Aspergillus coremiiformis]